MNPEIWGPPFWFVLHSVSINYPDNPNYLDKQQHFLFFQSLKQVLPCHKCRIHYDKYLNENPIIPYLDNKKNLMLWVLKCHNNVNKINNKKLFTLEEKKQLYHNIYTNNDKFKCQFTSNQKDLSKKNKINYQYILSIIFIILFIVLFITCIIMKKEV